MKTRLALASLLLTTCAISSAQTFDWENLSLGSFSSVVQTVGGITATGTGVGANVQVLDMTFAFAGFGTRSIYGDGGAGGNRVPLRVDFSAVLSQVRVEFGDGGNDDDGTVTITAFNSSDVQVDQESFAFGFNTGIESLTLDAPDISYIVGGTNGSIVNSVAFDNMSVTPVPEPASIIAIGAGLAALAASRRRNSAA